MIANVRIAIQRFFGGLDNLEYNALTEKDKLELSEMLNNVPGYEHVPYTVHKGKMYLEQSSEGGELWNRKSLRSSLRFRSSSAIRPDAK